MDIRKIKKLIEMLQDSDLTEIEIQEGEVVIEKNAGSCFGAAIRGGDLICKGSVGARTGIDMKGGTIIIGGDAGAFTGFIQQICGLVTKELMEELDGHVQKI